MMENPELRIVIFRERTFWVAQCLDHDIGVQAGDLRELDDRLRIALEAEREESLARFGTPFAGIDPAPKFFQDMWSQCSGSYQPRKDASDQSNSAIQCKMVIVA